MRETFICEDRRKMIAVLKIVRDQTALTSKVFEDRCRRLSQFCQSVKMFKLIGAPAAFLFHIEIRMLNELLPENLPNSQPGN